MQNELHFLKFEDVYAILNISAQLEYVLKPYLSLSVKVLMCILLLKITQCVLNTSVMMNQISSYHMLLPR